MLRTEHDDLMVDADDLDRTRRPVFAYPMNRISPNGVTANTRRATTANGKLWFEWMVQDLSALIVRAHRDAADRSFPLRNR